MTNLVNHGIYTDTDWRFDLAFTDANGVALALPNDYQCDVMAAAGGPVLYAFKSSGAGATDGTITKPVAGTLRFASTEASRTGAISGISGVFVLHLYDTTDNIWASEGRMLLALPGAPGSYVEFNTATNGATATSTVVGVKGDTGPANSLSIGTVTTAAAGSPAAAVISGTAPTQTLSLTIPAGDAGADGVITGIGLYQTTSSLGHRAGVLTYRKGSNGHAELVTSLEKYFPRGWNIRGEGDLPPGLKAYRVSRSGNNADGLTWATAYNSIQTALAQADVDVVFVDGRDRFTILQPFGSYTGSRDVAIISIGGRATVNNQTEETWSAGPQPNTWVSTSLGGTPVDVIDANVRRADGGYTPLVKVADAATVSATPGSWCQIGSGGSSTAVVRLHDGATPTNARVWVQRSVIQEFSGTGSCRFYIHGIDFVGGSAGAFRARNSTLTAVLTLSECGFYNSYNGDGLNVLDVGMVIAIKCKADQNFNDGFNYHVSNAIDPHFIEIDCAGTGALTADTGNGSTAHDNVRGIRINCDYARNAGPGIADVNTSKTYNVCCTSNANGPSALAWGFMVGDTAEAWVDAFYGEANQSVQIGAKGTATIHHRWCYPPPVNDSGTATIDGVFA